MKKSGTLTEFFQTVQNRGNSLSWDCGRLVLKRIIPDAICIWGFVRWVANPAGLTTGLRNHFEVNPNQSIGLTPGLGTSVF